LITGVSGFLGSYLARHLKDRHLVAGTYHEHAGGTSGCTTQQLDITDGAQVVALCREWRPATIVHTAAQADVERCEHYPEMASDVNVRGTANVARAASDIGARLIYISTDQVYDGAQGHYNETDVAEPRLVYGRSKLAGEQQAAAICSHVVILRLALMYGWGNPTRATFIDWLLMRLQTGQEVPLFVNQYRTPLYVGQAAEVIGRLIDTPGVQGVLNLGGAERLDRYTFGRKFCDVFDLPHHLLKPIETATLASGIARPRDCSMNSAKISALLDIEPLTVEEGLRVMQRHRGGNAGLPEVS
jgi:dTDP-4-dehydrorhamnose reductase